jgi:hypothetical protein
VESWAASGRKDPGSANPGYTLAAAEFGFGARDKMGDSTVGTPNTFRLLSASQ